MDIVAPVQGAVSTGAAKLSPNGEAALAAAARGWPVVPCCWPVDGQCGCKKSKPHTGKNIGKVPLLREWPAKATDDAEIIRHWWTQWPLANVAVLLDQAGLAVVDADGESGLTRATESGIDGGLLRRSKNPAYVFRRPPGCPAERRIHVDGLALDILSDGLLFIAGQHASGAPIELEGLVGGELVDAPQWVVDVLSTKTTAPRGGGQNLQVVVSGARIDSGGDPDPNDEPPVRLYPGELRRWRGEEFTAVPGGGGIDRSASLVALAHILARRGATRRTVAAALADRDQALGWRKYIDRPDHRELLNIADQAVAKVDAAVTAGGDDETLDAESLRELVNRQRERLLEAEARADALQELLTAWYSVLAAPSDVLRPSQKLTLLGAGTLVVARQESAGGEVSLQAIAEATGQSAATVSAALKRLEDPDPASGAPLARRVTRVSIIDNETGRPVVDDETGRPMLRSKLELVVHDGVSAPELLRRAVAFASGSPLPKHGGSAAAARARWVPCPDHPTAPVRLVLACSACLDAGQQSAIVMRDIELEADSVPAAVWRNPPPGIAQRLNLQVVDSDLRRDTECLYVDIDPQLGNSDPFHGLPLGSPTARALSA